MAKVQTATIYVMATQKQKSNTSYFGVCVTQTGKRKAEEFSGIYQASGRMDTQLKALIHSLSLVEKADEIHLYSDSKFVDNFLDGTVETWELADWCKGNGNSIECAEYWEELSRLAESKNVTFHKTKTKKEMAQPLKLINAEKEKPEVFMALNLGKLTDTISQEIGVYSQEETVIIVTEIKREDEADLNQEETDTLITKATKPAPNATNAKAAKETKGKKSSSVKETKGKKAPVEKVVEVKVIPESPVTKAEKIPVIQEKAKEEKAKKEKTKDGLSINLDKDTLAQCDKLFSDLGLDTNTAVKLFLKQSLRTKSIPFDLKLK